MQMTPGQPLTDADAAHVLATLARLIEAGPLHHLRPDEDSFSFETRDFLKLLRWSPRRLPDVRDFLENEIGQTRLSDLLGRVVGKTQIGRDHSFLYLGAPVDDETRRLRDDGLMVFQEALRLFVVGFRDGTCPGEDRMDHPHYVAGLQAGRKAFQTAVCSFGVNLRANLPLPRSVVEPMGQGADADADS